MTASHAGTTKAVQRAKDRRRKAAERAAKRARGIPEPHHVNNALVEAMAFVMASTRTQLVSGKVTDPQIDLRKIIGTALQVLVKRYGFDEAQSANVLKGRLGERQEFFNPYWTPHFPSCEPKCWSDTSIPKLANTPVTPTGPVRVGVEKAEA